VPLKAAHVLAVKGDRVELVAEIIDGARDAPDALIELVRERLAEHRLEIMTDPAILDPDSVSVASVLVSRDPLGPAHHQALESLGFSPSDTEAGGAEQASVFGGMFAKSRRSKLDRWIVPYMRARELSPRLGHFEALLLEHVPAGTLADVADPAIDAAIAAAAEVWKLRLVPGLDALSSLEDALLRERASKPGRWVLQPRAVIALAAFTGASIHTVARDTAWTDDEDAPLHIAAPRGTVVRSDPVLRVVDLVARGRQASLRDYADAVIRQSLTTGARP
jgi:hypothetical protein